LQERLYSRRQLIFGKHQAIWQCREEEACKATPMSPIKDIFKRPSIAPLLIGPVESSMSLDMLRRWQNIVELYTAQDLTYRDDRLPALAGVASVFGRSGDTYVSGLWKSKIPAGLCWSAHDVDFTVKIDHFSGSATISTTPSYYLGATKNPDYEVPSWTW
jgi:hypothetical protein